MCKQCQGLKHSRPKSKVLETSAGHRASEPERNSAAVCAKRYFTEAQEDGYSWHSHPCSVARRWGRHTVNCRQNRKAESCEICILTAAVYKSVKSHRHTRWYTKNQKRWRREYSKGDWLWSKPVGGRNYMKKHFNIWVGSFTSALQLLFLIRVCWSCTWSKTKNRR